MPIQTLKKRSDLEKRLKILRQQVYGSADQQVGKSAGQNSDTLILSDTTYLYHDLSKITILSSFAIGIQVILFFLSKNHIVNINLF